MMSRLSSLPSRIKDNANPDVRDFRAVCSIRFARLRMTPHKVASVSGPTGQRKEDSRRRHFFLVGALLAALCISDLSAEPFSDSEIAEILAAHNAVRRRVARAESQRLGGTVSIPDLIWDSTVAAVAQQWADSLIKRNPPTGGHRKREELQQLNLGENWYLAWSEGTPDLSARAVVESWAEEEKWYNYDDNTCAPGKECLHYTQLVWSNTQRLGAGRAVRTTDDGRTYVVWVCNYASAGNITGERPYSVMQARGQSKEKVTTTHDTIPVR
jgi:pathogenesis-related protein 1